MSSSPIASSANLRTSDLASVGIAASIMSTVLMTLVSVLPAQLSSQRYYDDCFAALSDNGIMVVNMWKGYPHYDEYLERINNSFAGNWVIVDAEDGFNQIVLAVKNTAFPPAASTIRHHANLLCESHPLNFQAQANKLVRALPVSAV